MTNDRLGATQAGILAEFRELAERWRADATWVKRYAEDNQIVTTLERAAADLDALIAAIAGNDVYVTAAEYGELYRVSPQTVSNWIRKGKLKSLVTGGGRYLIRRQEIPDKNRNDEQPHARTRANRAQNADGRPAPSYEERMQSGASPRKRPGYKPKHWNDSNFRQGPA